MTPEQWQAIKNNDAGYDGVFYYGLKTAGTICRPSCTSGKVSMRNVVIFNTLEDGIAAGYRPCSKCRPDVPGWRGAGYDLAERAAAYIRDHYTEKFSLDTLSEVLFVNKIYLSKTFKSVTGTTLLKYHNQVRCDKACELLRDTEFSVEIIGSKVGFTTPSHFAQVFHRQCGCTPSQYRKRYLEGEL